MNKIALKTFQIENRRYLGSKTKLLNFIDEIVKEHCVDVHTVADLFSGTGVVPYHFMNQNKKVIVNDLLYSNYVSYQTWFSNDKVDEEKIEETLLFFNEFKTIEDNYVSIHFGNRYFEMENARKIGWTREMIETYKREGKVNDREYFILLTSLLYAMDKVANTVGHYDAYRKEMSTLNQIEFKMPLLRDSIFENEIYNADANGLVRQISADLVYIDTPYNSRQYSDAYHLLENIMEWKKPDVIGVAKKMGDRSHIKSDYSTSKALVAFQDLISHIQGKYILVSYNNMGKKGNGRSNAKISHDEIMETLSSKGDVQVFEVPFQVYTTGKTKIENHREVLYLCQT